MPSGKARRAWLKTVSPSSPGPGICGEEQRDRTPIGLKPVEHPARIVRRSDDLVVVGIATAKCDLGRSVGTGIRDQDHRQLRR